MILSAQSIRRLPSLIEPFNESLLSSAGYDVRLAQTVTLSPGGCRLASTMERFTMPNWLMGEVVDKSTNARRFISLFNTRIQPGWCGYLTLEIVNHSDTWVRFEAGDAIAQIVFMRLDEPTESPYAGKYQDQTDGPVGPLDNIVTRHIDSIVTRHIVTQQQDEYACSCGRRWDVSEGDECVK